jgi:gas vesicle protein
VKLGGASELNYEEKLNKIRESLYKKLQDIRNQFTQIEKIKVETIKRTDELKNSAEHELNKIEETIAKSKDLVSESKERLHSEISTLKSEVEEKYNEMRKRIIEAMTPA